MNFFNQNNNQNNNKTNMFTVNNMSNNLNNDNINDLERIKNNYIQIYSDNKNSQFILPLYSTDRVCEYPNDNEINYIINYFNTYNPNSLSLTTDICFGISNVLKKIKFQEEKVKNLEKEYLNEQEISEEILRNLIENLNKNIEIISHKKFEIIEKFVEILKIRNRINKSKNINSLDYTFEQNITNEIRTIKKYIYEYQELIKKIEKLNLNNNTVESKNLQDISFEIVDLLYKKINDLFSRINKLID